MVYATDFNAERLGQIAHPNIHTQVLDVTDAESVLAGVQWAQPDVQLNCPGCVHGGSILEATDEEFDQAIDFNVRAIWRSIRAALHGMLERAKAPSSICPR